MSKYRRLEEIASSLVDYENGRRCHHVSFILCKNKIIAIGTNNAKTHPANLINRKVSRVTGLDYSDQKHTCSEFNAILKLRRKTNIDTKKCTLINIRYDMNKQVAVSKPCQSCQNLLRYFSFKKVIWSGNDGKYHNY